MWEESCRREDEEDFDTDNMCRYKGVYMCLLGGSPYGVGEDTPFARREGCWHKAGNEDWFRWWNFPIDLSC